MPAGRHNRQTPRHDGGKSRVCPYCGGVGARVVTATGFAHRRCIGPEPRPVVTMVDGARVHGDKPLSVKSRRAVKAVIRAARKRLSQNPT